MSPAAPTDDVYAETLAVFDRGEDPSEPLTAPEVADALEYERRTVYNRLQTLVERGRLRTKKTGARSRIWWRPPSVTMPTGPESDDSASATNGASDSATVGVVVLDADGRIAWVNETVERYFGIERSAVIGRDGRQPIHNAHSERCGAVDAFTETSPVAEEHSGDDGTEYLVTVGDGREERWLEYQRESIGSGRCAGEALDLYYDVTDRKRAQEEHELQLSVSHSIAEAPSLEDGLRAALADVCEWTDWEVGQAWVPTGEGVVERLPPSYLESAAYAPFEETSLDFAFGPGEGIPGRVLESQEPVWFSDVSAVSAEIYPRTALAADVGLKAGLGIPVVTDGEIAVVLEFYMSEHREIDDRLVEVVSSVAADLGGLVTREEGAKLLDQERTLLAEVMEAAPAGITVYSPSGEVDRINTRAAALRRRSPVDTDTGEFRADDRTFYDENGDLIPFEEQPFATVLETGGPIYDWTAQIDLLDGSSRWVSISAAPILNGAGEIEQVVAVEENVTELKEQYHAITEAANDVIVTIDEQSTIRSVNPAVEEVFGYSPTELTGESLTVLIPNELTEQHRQAIARYLETGERRLDWDYIELPGLHADGSEIPLAVSFSEIEYEGDTYFTGIMRDVTERKERERALRAERDLIERIVETSPVGIATLDADGAFDLVNDRTTTILGRDLTGTEGYEQRVELLDPITPDDQRLSSEDLPSYRVFHGGETIHDVEIGLQQPTGERTWVSVSGTPMRENGSVIGAVITYADVTERLEYERKLRVSNERLERFAYAASHDLQEPLRMVSSYLQLLEQRYADDLDEDGEEFIEFAVDGADRMKAMIDGLLDYSRVETQGKPFDAVDLNGIFEDVRANLEIQIEETDAEITTEVLPVVEGDEDQLRQVLQNLLSNALKYSGDEPPRVHVGAERSGSKWELSVRDEGIGIDQDQISNVFRVFQRLHSREEHSGTGIGLALCQRIVERHQGEIWAESEPGAGATFFVTLPAADGDA